MLAAGADYNCKLIKFLGPISCLRFLTFEAMIVKTAVSAEEARRVMQYSILYNNEFH